MNSLKANFKSAPCVANIRKNQIKLKCVPYERPLWTTVAPSVITCLEHVQLTALIHTNSSKHHITHSILYCRFLWLYVLQHSVHVQNAKQIATTITRMNKAQRVHKTLQKHMLR